MGGQRVNLTELRKIIPDPYGQAAGLVPAVTQYTDERGLTQYIYTLQSVAPGSAQTKIQFQYNGVGLGTSGTVDHFNVVSSWATFARAGDTVTFTIPTPVQSLNSLTGALSVTSLDGSVAIIASGSTVDLSTSTQGLIRARVATAAALPTNVYANGASGVGATLTGVGVGVLTVDGVAVALSDVVLVQSEVTQSHNGVYVVTTLGTVGVAYVLTRDPRMNQSGEFTGALVTTGPDGSTKADTVFECTAISPVTVGTTAITFQSTGSTYTPPVTTKGDLFGFSTVPARVPIGTNGQILKADSTQALGVQYADLSAGVSFRVGRNDGAVLLANFQRVFILPCAYDQITTGSWEFYTFPGSTCVIDVQYIAFGTADPTTANSIVGGTHPATSGGQTATGVTSGWTASLARGGFIAIQILSNDLAREIRFFMPGRKVI